MEMYFAEQDIQHLLDQTVLDTNCIRSKEALHLFL